MCCWRFGLTSGFAGSGAEGATRAASDLEPVAERRDAGGQTEALLICPARDERERNAAQRPRPGGDRAGQWTSRGMKRALVTAG